MIDKNYKQIIKQDEPCLNHYMYFLKHSSPTNSRRILIWLRVIGLMETWDVMRHRKYNT